MSERRDIVILLDRSGSMQHARDDHEGGLRSFVRDMRELAGDTHLTFIRFDSFDPCEVVCEARQLVEFPDSDLTLVPRGDTPLLDAVGTVLSRYAETLSPQTIMMIITDGQENASRKWTKEQVQKLVKEREDAGWKILYLGANVDEFLEAAQLGVGRGTTLGYEPGNVTQMYQISARNVGATFAANLGGMGWSNATSNLTFTPAQRLTAKQPKPPQQPQQKEEK